MTAAQRMADERATNERPVGAVADTYVTVTTPQGSGRAPVYSNACFTEPQPAVRRAVLMLHGRLRNADAYYALAEQALAHFQARHQAGRDDIAGHADGVSTLILAPQFLATADIEAHGLPADTLGWEWTEWMGGGTAEGPIPASSFEVLDSLLALLADPLRYPALEEVVVAGHSGGGQVVHRYAVVARPSPALRARGIALRYVVANPSSYVYFDAQRPDGQGGFAPFDRVVCPDFNRWKYGLENLPAYATDTDAKDHAGGSGHFERPFEADYVGQDVTMLLGQEDCDPAHQALDRSSAANAQGPHRLARGRNYFDYLRRRHGAALESKHTLHEIPGAAHDAAAVFQAPAGLRALFGAM